MPRLRTRRNEILSTWEAQVRALPPLQTLDLNVLRDHLPDLLDQLDDWVDRAPSGKDRPTEKPLGAASEHALNRLEIGLDLKTLVYEYRLLRRAIFLTGLARDLDLDALVAMNDAIDQAIAESVSLFAEESRRRLEHTRDRFIGIVSHDLRNPLSAISAGAANLLRARTLGEGQADTVQRIVRAAGRMARVIADVLDFARVRLGPGILLTPTPSDLGRICREAVDEVHLVTPGKQIVFEASGDLKGEWEEERVARVVHNLLANALKYAATIVRVGVRSEGDDVICEVSNDGPAIPPESLKAIFEPLWTSDAKAGLGFGLFIVREIVSAHGGAISVTSSPAEGTTFTIRLPRHPPSKAA